MGAKKPLAKGKEKTRFVLCFSLDKFQSLRGDQ